MALDLAQALINAVQAQDFSTTADSWRDGQAIEAFPSIDLAVVRFKTGRAPIWANVLFSREHPQGLVAELGTQAGSVRSPRFDADQRNAAGDSLPWLPGADWSRLQWQALQGSDLPRVVATYPASLLKLMVAVGVALAVDQRLCDWPDELDPMLVLSDNEATDACVALLHRVGMIDPLAQRLRDCGLMTLRLEHTRADGGWRNAQGAGVGAIHMTAWDSLRLLWLLDAEAPPAPWLAPGTQLLSDASRDHLRALMASVRQAGLILSSGALRDLPGWVAGLPDVPAFAHKTGNTDNYASDAGIVRTASCHYIVALLSNLGSRYAPHPRCATTWRVPALGAALHQLMETI